MRVLIAEDDSISRRVLDAKLTKWGYDVVVTCDGPEAWEVLRSGDSPDLAILDWMMPGMDGIDVCRRVREMDGARKYTYVMLLTTKGQKEDVVEGMTAGADDYIRKPFDSGELRARLKAARRVLDLQEKLLKTQEALRDEALHDSLTGLWNRTAILDILQRELSRSQRSGEPVGVIIADVDHFKKINDTCGHKAGDAVLFKIADTMRGGLRDYDAIGRYGGEEFLIVMPGCDAEDAAGRAEAIRAQVARRRIGVPSGTVSLSICMGVTASSGCGGPSIDDLIQAADMAMYEAKKAGRNRVAISVQQATGVC